MVLLRSTVRPSNFARRTVKSVRNCVKRLGSYRFLSNTGKNAMGITWGDFK